MRGVAVGRGEVWAEENGAQRPAGAAPRTVAAWQRQDVNVARTKVADLAGDPQLCEQLATELARWAEIR